MLVVMKFGGTAVESGERIRHISNIALNYQQKMGFDVILVTSAVKGMTDEILVVAESVKKGDKCSCEPVCRPSKTTASISHR